MKKTAVLCVLMCVWVDVFPWVEGAAAEKSLFSPLTCLTNFHVRRDKNLPKNGLFFFFFLRGGNIHVEPHWSGQCPWVKTVPFTFEHLGLRGNVFPVFKGKWQLRTLYGKGREKLSDHKTHKCTFCDSWSWMWWRCTRKKQDMLLRTEQKHIDDSLCYSQWSQTMTSAKCFCCCCCCSHLNI